MESGPETRRNQSERLLYFVLSTDTPTIICTYIHIYIIYENLLCKSSVCEAVVDFNYNSVVLLHSHLDNKV